MGEIMYNKKFLIILALLFSIFLIVSSVSAEDCNIETDGLTDNQLSEEVNSEEDENILVINEEDNSLDSEVEENILTLNEEDSSLDLEEENTISEGPKLKNILSGSASSQTGNQVSIPDVTVSEGNVVLVKISTNNVNNYDITYTIQLFDSNNNVVTGFDGLLPFGNHTTQISLGYLKPGSYVLSYSDDDGLACSSNINVLERKVTAKITVNNFSAYYKSGKTVNIKTIDKYNNKPISLKVKLTFKNTSNKKTSTFYLTTNSNGIGKFIVNLGKGTYKLTVSSANSKISSNKASSTVKVKKLPIKVTVPNYSSYYKSGKKLTVKAINKSSNKGISVKLKFVYKKAKSKAKVVYVTTNKNGIAKVRIPVGIGKYKLTVTPASSNFKASKVSRNVNVNKYVIFKAGKYRGKLTYKQVLALKKAKANGKDKGYYVFTGKYYYYKEPIYKKVKVKKTKWVYKHVLSGEDYWDEYYNDYTTYEYSTDKYWDNGWTWYGNYYKTYDDGQYTQYYTKFKKKVTYWATKKIKTGKYKKGKDKIYMTISTNSGKGQNGKGDFIEVWSSRYWEDHEDNIIFKKTKIV